jgi:drug/metabolite transporter (DMT)-like permease
MVDVAHFSFAEQGMVGNLLILLNCLSYAAFLVLARPVLLRLPHTMVVAWSYLAGGAVVLAIGGRDLLGAPYGAMPALAWAGLAYIVLLATLLNYLLNTWAIRHSSSSLVAVYTTLQPVVAAVLAVLLLGESIGWKEAAGFALIVAGLALITVHAPRPAPPPARSPA